LTACRLHKVGKNWGEQKFGDFSGWIEPEKSLVVGLVAFSSHEPAAASLENALKTFTHFLHANRDHFA
jgi:hypothetical protein